MRRRDLLVLMGGAVLARPRAAGAQASAMPVIGYLNRTSPAAWEPFTAAFRHGLGDAGFVEGQNVAIEYRWAHGQDEMLPALAADLVKRNVAIIAATGGTAVVQAARSASATIPIVFTVAGDPVRSGLVASLARPGGNATGVSMMTGEIGAKRLELLRELLPNASVLGLLVNPRVPLTEALVSDVRAAADSLDLRLHLVQASDEAGLDAAFATLAERRIDALLVGVDSFFGSQRARLVALAARHRFPAIYEWRQFVEAGGLVSYGPSLTHAYRLAGLYVGRILKGAKPADLPVQQPTLFELVVNRRTAQALGLAIPPAILERADEVIE